MTAAKKFQHIVITRYFVRFSQASGDVDAIMAPDRAWLDARFELFRDICFPSVAAQSEQNFVWLLYFDRRTPADYLERVRTLIASRPSTRIVLCELFDDAARTEAVNAELESDTQWLLTTRLDNDDGWRRDFVERLHRSLSFEHREFLNYPVGLIHYSGMTLLYRHPSNAFISLIEPVDGFVTVWCAQHFELERVAPIRQLPSFPAFVQMAHAGARSNKPRGVRVHRLLALAGFEAIHLPSNGRAETDLEVMLFNMTVAPVWALRDRVRSFVRKVSGR